MAQRLKGYLRLMRPANVVTAVADVLAGLAIAQYFIKGFENIFLPPVLLLCLSTACLYAGGVVLNDVFDAELDAVERPERPIPSGLIKRSSAGIFGLFLLLLGIVSAGFIHEVFFHYSFFIALAIAASSVLYDGWGKHHSIFGPLNMGLCRGLNLALGISIVPAALLQYWYLGLVPIVYIAAITAISRGEVHGGSRRVLYVAAFLYALVIAAILVFGFKNGHLLIALPFLVLFAFLIYKPLQQAIASPVGPRIGKAVKAGVLALIVMNAAWAAAFGAPFLAVLVLLLLPLALLLARLFAVT